MEEWVPDPRQSSHALPWERPPTRGTEFDSQDAAKLKSAFLQFASFLRGSQQLLVLVYNGSLVGRPSTPGDHWVTRAPGGILPIRHSPDPWAFTGRHLPSRAVQPWETPAPPSSRRPPLADSTISQTAAAPQGVWVRWTKSTPHPRSLS